MQDTKIQWTDTTINFWIGCKKISAGCKYCYMYRQEEKYRDPSVVSRTSDNTFYQALRLKEPRKIFTNSLSDFFIEEADNWRNDAWDVIRQTPQHEWQILTKRPHLIKERLPKSWNKGWDNVMLGVTVENQECFHRAYELAQIPAKRRFLSVEPLLEDINLLEEVNGIRPIDEMDWVIVGGESGKDYGQYRYRPCKIEWIERIIHDLRNHAPHVKIFVKQLGTYQKNILGLRDQHGGNMDEWNDELNHLKIREYPSPVVEQLALF